MGLFSWLVGKKRPRKGYLSSEYYAYINSEKWQKTRRLVFLIWGRRCWHCHKSGATQVHHLRYDHFGQGGIKEALDCRPVHSACHGTIEEQKREERQRAWRKRKWRG